MVLVRIVSADVQNPEFAVKIPDTFRFFFADLPAQACGNGVWNNHDPVIRDIPFLRQPLLHILALYDE